MSFSRNFELFYFNIQKNFKQPEQPGNRTFKHPYFLKKTISTLSFFFSFRKLE